ncbi:50S ribosomal protein L22 [Candidatus Nomurabacteria bacterium RIFCSPLOWO2_12_FULL_46_14]|uniref:Large ribosomal subunit protein uL22 n=1 Tax=Candidatus Nomurabacteria bacterium RIFCSPLOWO2_12_FULL_46_14 TaxID=1801797 RepID=A0A1F6Y8Q6_9BACT|nr:MAG: 50S ribosomal protein L22 [Candidatus Nomurabacteria bacterium RIFCSPLOWO2_12_FULL_46_14]
MRAFLKNYRQSPRKVRLVANMLRGRNAAEAESQLDFLAKRAGGPLKKLLHSAVHAAGQSGIAKENLFIKEIRVDKGPTYKRMMPAAMGSAHRINKRTSRITLLLGEQAVKSVKSPPKADQPRAEKKKVK